MRRNATTVNKEGFTLIEVIVTLVVAAILAALFVNFMGPSLMKSSPISAVRAQNHYALIQIVEEINVDYNKLASDFNLLVTLRSRIAAGNYGTYTQSTGFITFDPTTHIEQASASATNILKVTISKGDQTIVTLFTK